MEACQHVVPRAFMFVSGRLKNFIFKVSKNQALFALRQDAVKNFVSDKGVGNSFWQELLMKAKVSSAWEI